MCIRDRAGPDRAAGLARLVVGAGRPVAGDGVAAGARRTGAVSYTHLRAHETVLDLVCRLLLEKKKTTA